MAYTENTEKNETNQKKKKKNREASTVTNNLHTGKRIKSRCCSVAVGNKKVEKLLMTHT